LGVARCRWTHHGLKAWPRQFGAACASRDEARGLALVESLRSAVSTVPLYPLLRPLLFRLRPERAHAASLLALRALAVVPPLLALQRRVTPLVDDPVEALGLRFRNRVGLAAGYDKDGRALRGLAALGFGHVEVGTVTPRPQPGNPKPRVFRLVAERSVINRMGFPGEGAARVAPRLRRRPPGLVVGVNIGKQRTTEVAQAVDDYLALVETFAPLCDYLVVNVSSPNTPGLRQLESAAQLRALVAPLVARRDALARGGVPRRPLLVKLSPDLADEDLDAAVDALLASGVDGLIATNTTLSRAGAISPAATESGGLSGALLRERATAVLQRAHARAAGRLVVIGAGGVVTGADAVEKRHAGAALVQLYTGLVYRGPGLVAEVAQALAGG
jgi:dihydroorotate dehydrogenase